MIIRNNIEKRLTILSKRTFANIIVRSVRKGTETAKKVVEAVKPIPPVTPPVIRSSNTSTRTHVQTSNASTNTSSTSTAQPSAKLRILGSNEYQKQSTADKVQRPLSWPSKSSNTESTPTPPPINPVIINESGSSIQVNLKPSAIQHMSARTRTRTANRSAHTRNTDNITSSNNNNNVPATSFIGEADLKKAREFSQRSLSSTNNNKSTTTTTDTTTLPNSTTPAKSIEYTYTHTYSKPLSPFFSQPQNRTTLTIPHFPVNFMSKRNMSFIRVIRPDSTNTDPQSTANNVFVTAKKGVIQHPEINERVCDLKDCKLKSCPTLCSRLLSDRSVGHGTHGNPSITPPSTLVTISSTDLQGLPKTQNAVMYGTPHDVTVTQANSSEMQPHTTNLNTDPQALAIVKKYAK